MVIDGFIMVGTAFSKKNICSCVPISKGASTYDVRWFLVIFDLPTYPNQMIYYISLLSKIRWGLTYLLNLESNVICGCSLKVISRGKWLLTLGWFPPHPGIKHGGSLYLWSVWQSTIGFSIPKIKEFLFITNRKIIYLCMPLVQWKVMLSKYA